MNSKSGFRFKQFTVDDSNCGMKVGTDAVLLGAWISVVQAGSILDVGTGSGLIALMLAQRSDARITGVEINEPAYLQCRENFLTSPWADRLEAVHGAIQQFRTALRYDLIVTNPPFFKNALKAPEPKRNTARHNDELSFECLLEAVDRLLSDRGSFAFILPVEEAKLVQQLAAAHRLYTRRSCTVIAKEGKAPNRLLCQLSRQEMSHRQETLIIRDIHNQYTDQYKELTKDFYLFLTETPTSGVANTSFAPGD